MSDVRTPTQDLETLHGVQDFLALGPEKGLLYGPHSWTLAYVRLCGLARQRIPAPLSGEAIKLLRPMRLAVERAVVRHWEQQSKTERNRLLFGRDVFGHSTKQGVSFRLGLESCQPTKACAAKCYAHDGNDCLPQPVTRGALNSLIAREYESGTMERGHIQTLLYPHIVRACQAALKEMEQAREDGFLRSPRVRFSHVGDIAAYPDFANEIGRRTHFGLGMGLINRGLPRLAPVIVTYTRRRDAVKLDPSWTVLFSLDHTTPSRIIDLAMRKHASRPGRWRIARCGFDGAAPGTVDVTFAEHHGNQHFPVTAGGGFVCPATRAGNKLHGCDANRCDLCFRQR